MDPHKNTNQPLSEYLRNAFRDINGKPSSKRIIGAVGCLVGYVCLFLTGFHWFDVSETLLLGVLAVSEALIVSTIREIEKKDE